MEPSGRQGGALPSGRPAEAIPPRTAVRPCREVACPRRSACPTNNMQWSDMVGKEMHFQSTNAYQNK